MNCLYSIRTESKLKSHENVCKDHDYCHIIMPEEDNNILKYYNHFIIKWLAEEFEEQFDCLVENTEKYIVFSVPIQKHENGKTIK